VYDIDNNNNNTRSASSSGIKFRTNKHNGLVSRGQFRKSNALDMLIKFVGVYRGSVRQVCDKFLQWNLSMDATNGLRRQRFYNGFLRDVINTTPLIVLLDSHNHRLRGSASTVLTATGQVNGRRYILTPYSIETPEPTATEFGTVDYVCERTPKPNLAQIHPLGPSGKMGEYNVFCAFLFIPFFLRRLHVRPVDGFSRATAQKTWNHARMCLLRLKT